MIYMLEMISVVLINIVATVSVISIRIVGQMPTAYNNIVDIADVIRMLAIGSAKRLVKRKYFGKEPKCNHATGPVKI